MAIGVIFGVAHVSHVTRLVEAVDVDLQGGQRGETVMVLQDPWMEVTRVVVATGTEMGLIM